MSTGASIESRTLVDVPAQVERVHGDVRIQSLQHLRVLAASVIVLYHAELQITRLTDGAHQHSLGFGAAGTDLFFAIGGFILVYTTHNRKDTFAAFLYRRVFSMAPRDWLLTRHNLAVVMV